MDNYNEEYVLIYKSPYYLKKRKQKSKKVVVFDLDETLGDFTDLELLWSGVQLYNYQKNEYELFKKLLNLYPEFLRYGINSILEYLYLKKREGICKSLFIYTNNQSPPKWIKMILQYFQDNLNIKKMKSFLIKQFMLLK